MKPMILVLTAILLVTSCAGGTKRSETQRNDADIAFARDMIPHHEQALEMAELVDAADASPEVVALAKQIKQAQDPEISLLKKWLNAWGAEEMSDSMQHGGDHETVPPGPDFDRAWLTAMIAHHEGAIEMAAVEIEAGDNPDAIDLAEDIIASQSKEITTMKELLR